MGGAPRVVGVTLSSGAHSSRRSYSKPRMRSGHKSGRTPTRNDATELDKYTSDAANSSTRARRTCKHKHTKGKKKACPPAPNPEPTLRTKPTVVYLGRTPDTEDKRMMGGRGRGGEKGRKG
eukprot:scaffold231501_cov22-Tisochrysis_lutea.AAC.1